MAYTPIFRKQLTGTACAGSNCNMASAAMLADRMTLGLVQKTPDQMRTLSGTAGRCTDGIVGNDGTSQSDALTALAKLGLYPKAYQNFDPAKMRLSAKQGMILSVDYGSVPYAERGDKKFTGNHAEYVNDTRLGPEYHDHDPLCDARRAEIPRHPKWVGQWLEKAAEDYKLGGGNVYCIVNPWRRAKRRITVTGKVNIRAAANRNTAPIATFTTEDFEASHLADIGESIGGNPRWWRIWVPSHSRVGFVHDSVVTVG